MKPMAILAAVIAGAGFFGLVPFESGDISDFCPVEILCMERVQTGVRLRADGSIAASGKTVPEALRALAGIAPGRLLLDTVDYLVCVDLLPDAGELLDCGLRPATCVCCAVASPEEPETLARYLREHTARVTLGELEDGKPLESLPTLRKAGSGWILEDKR